MVFALCGVHAMMKAPTDGASLQLLLGARRRLMQSACSPLPPALRPGTYMMVFALCDGAAMHAWSDGASSRLLLGARWRRIDIACSCLPPALRPGTCRMEFAFATEPPWKLRQMEQACGCSSVRGGGGLISGVLVSAAGTTTRHCMIVFAFCDGAAMEAPTDGASLRLLLDERWRWMQSRCSCLPPALRPGTCMMVFAFATEPPWKLRLMEQACGCSSV